VQWNNPDDPEDAVWGWLVMNWYKDRGETHSAFILDGREQIPLPGCVAEAVLKQYEGELQLQKPFDL